MIGLMPFTSFARRLLPTAMIATVGLSSPAAATAYTCSNADLVRVVCGDGACEAAASGAFTPMTVAIDGYDYFDVCAEDMCWSGQGERQTVGRYEIVTGVGLAWLLGGVGQPNDAVLAFDPTTGMGTILAPPFYSPIRCMVSPGE
jgi:hypothetical protein